MADARSGEPERAKGAPSPGARSQHWGLRLGATGERQLEQGQSGREQAPRLAVAGAAEAAAGADVERQQGWKIHRACIGAAFRGDIHTLKEVLKEKKMK